MSLFSLGNRASRAQTPGTNLGLPVLRKGEDCAVPSQTPLDSAEKPVSSDRLDSWKEIAAYLKRDVRTVQRYGRWLAALLPRPTSRLKLEWDKASELLKRTGPQVFTR